MFSPNSRLKAESLRKANKAQHGFEKGSLRSLVLSFVDSDMGDPVLEAMPGTPGKGPRACASMSPLSVESPGLSCTMLAIILTSPLRQCPHQEAQGGEWLISSLRWVSTEP